LSTGVLFFDSSALLKLVIAEPETPALVRVLEAGTDELAGSELLLTEVIRAAARVSDQALSDAELVLSRMTLLPLNRACVTAAGLLQPRELRALDALHIAAAMTVGPRLRGLVTYDVRQQAAARHAGLSVLAPA